MRDRRTTSDRPSDRVFTGLALCVLPRVLLSSIVIAAAAPPAAADELSDAWALYNSGKYAESIRVATEGIARMPWSEDWRQLKIRAEMETGRYADARATVEDALRFVRSSIRLRLAAHEVYRFNDDLPGARRMMDEISLLVERQGRRYVDPPNRIAMGRFFRQRGADARQVLEIFYDDIRERRPSFAPAYVASGELALDKHDYAVAAESYEKAAELTPDDPDVHLGLARAYAQSRPDEAAASIARALELNPNHIDSLLAQIDHMIDAEQYDGASELLEKVFEVNPARPEACAYRAILAHLDNDSAGETTWRTAALVPWSTNPEVDHLIGRKLSQKYRFREGAAYQRWALDFDRDYLPAKIQLSQDLLRIGEEAEGWRLAGEVYESDGYNVLAHNLVTLEEKLAEFKTLEADGIVLRMDADEAEIYGASALELLKRAKRDLSAKYEVTLDEPIAVEIFPDQSDFAVRTFGMPGGAGYLGVCFGNLVTANSPASQGESPSNWQAVLWHEFCHVVTLGKTKNKMPRWLSEGISVYEELQENPTWGQSMNAQFRKMVLGGESVPVSQLSGAFLSPKSSVHLMFAYYESSLVIEYLVDRYGLETITLVLDDLAEGKPINAALEQRVAPIAQLDKDFEAFIQQRASELGVGVDWEEPELERGADLAATSAWSRQHPDNVLGLEALARQYIRQRQWSEAKQPLETLLELYPENIAPGNAYSLLALVHRELGETEAERSVLNRLVALDGDAVGAYLRLMELSGEAEDWEALALNAERMLAVNPLVRTPHRSLARAAEALGDPARAIGPSRALLQMDPTDPAEAHYRLGRLLSQTGELASARRHVLMALEEAPRYRAAHRTLLEIIRRVESETPETAEEMQP